MLKKNNLVCNFLGCDFVDYEKIKEDYYVEYWESFCNRCGKKDIYIASVYD